MTGWRLRAPGGTERGCCAPLDPCGVALQCTPPAAHLDQIAFTAALLHSSRSCSTISRVNCTPHPVLAPETTMTDAATALRAKQAPLKESYRSDPSAALVTLKSSGSLDSSSITCKLSTGAAVAQAQSKIAGLHPRAGGDDPTISGELCSGDMLLEALVACAGVTLKAVATALSVPLKGGTVYAEGDLDFRGTMGVDREAPVGFKAIRLGFDLQLDGELGEDGDSKIEKLGKLTERYCVVLQTIAKKPEISVKVMGNSETEDGIEKGYAWGQKL